MQIQLFKVILDVNVKENVNVKCECECELGTLMWMWNGNVNVKCEFWCLNVDGYPFWCEMWSFFQSFFVECIYVVNLQENKIFSRNYRGGYREFFPEFLRDLIF